MTTALMALAASLPVNAGIKIQIDYKYDTNGWFQTNNRAAVLEAVADYLGSMLGDTLLRIDQSEFPGSSWTAMFTNPQTGSVANEPGLVVPENTIIVYAGARPLGSFAGTGGTGGWSGSGTLEWFQRVQARGNPGALSFNPAEQTDFAPAVGSISFNTNTTFNMSTTANGTGTAYVSVAMHELLHVLGIGTANSWNNLVSGGQFNGAAATYSNGMTTPAADSGGNHFNQSTSNNPAFGVFSNPHGRPAPVLMRTTITATDGLLTVTSDLDLAALVDIGWQVTPPLRVSSITRESTSASVRWPSSSFINYEIRKSPTLDFGSSPALPYQGDGGIITHTDESPYPQRGFYLLSEAAISPASTAEPVTTTTSLSVAGSMSTRSVQQRDVECMTGGNDVCDHPTGSN